MNIRDGGACGKGESTGPTTAGQPLLCRTQTCRGQNRDLSGEARVPDFCSELRAFQVTENSRKPGKTDPRVHVGP